MSSSDSNSSGETPQSSPAHSSPPAPPSSDNGSSSSPPPQSSPQPDQEVSDSPPPSSPSPPSGSSSSSSPPPSSSPSPPSGSSTPSNNSPSSSLPSTPSGNGRKNMNAPIPQSSSYGSGDSPPALLGPKRSHSVDRDELPSVIAISAGAALLFACLVALLVCCLRKQKKKSDVNTYMTGPSGKVNDNGYNRASPQNHYMNMPPPPGAAQQRWQALAANGQPFWQAQRSPPALPIRQNSDLSSSNFSAPYGTPMPPPPPSLEIVFDKGTFTYEELLAATGGFAEDNILGQGGFGYVHKGVLPNGKEIAVKSLKATSGQGDREFQAEIDIISRVHHRHLVSLVGYCISGERKLLVYEFVPNKTLEYHLYERGTPVMDWPTRLRIAIGAAKGLAYLHEDCHPRIIHRDIKAANILLECNFDAKVADFGLAKLNQDNHTHVSTRVMGTFGYLAPEYASSGKLTDKSDVFSFGMMLLELITGRPPVDVTGQYEDSLVDWARPLCIRAMETGDYDELVDPRLENNYNKHELSCMVACASASIRHSARRRPKMSQIIRALEGDISLENLNEGGVKPGQSSVFSNGTNSDYDASSYSADMRKFRKLVLSEDEGSSEYAQTSEYGSKSSFNSGNDSAESKRGRREKLNV